MAEFAVGDRVVLAEPDGWVQPYRGWAQKGRVAIVERVFGDCLLIRFPTKRPPKYPDAFQMNVRARHVTRANEPETAPL